MRLMIDNGYPGTQGSLQEWLDYISEQHWQAVDMGLARMQTMVQRLGLKRPAGTVVTVAGTNGKGSTSVLLEQLLLRAGKTVGTTLSPHVNVFNERIRINGRELNDAEICSAFSAVEAVREALSLTYFEYSALAALYCFREAKVDVAILEIGLGGRLDAFNVVAANVAVITSIGLDHQQFLGDDLDSIGREKAGILRTGQSVVLGPDMPASVLEACADLALQPEKFGDSFSLSVTSGQADKTEFVLSGSGVEQRFETASVAPQNAAIAYVAARATGVTPAGGDLDWAAQRVCMPGRLQQRRFADRQLLLDVAHNPSGVEFLLAELRQRDITPDCIVLGMLAGKDHAGVISCLLMLPVRCLLLADTHGDRSMSARELKSCIQGQTVTSGVGDCRSETRLLQPAVEVLSGNLDEALPSATQVGDVILVLGSFNIVEQAQLGIAGWHATDNL